MDKVNQVLNILRTMSARELCKLADKLGIDPKSFKGVYEEKATYKGKGGEKQ